MIMNRSLQRSFAWTNAWLLAIGTGALPILSAQTASSTPANSAPMPLVAPLFIEDETRTSLITMVNGESVTVDLDIVLYDASGSTLARKTVSLSSFGAGDCRRRSPARIRTPIRFRIPRAASPSDHRRSGIDQRPERRDSKRY
jgi:hypothetical protein